MSDPLKNKKFCVLPFIHFSNRPTGNIRLCCEAESPHDWLLNDGNTAAIGRDDFMGDVWNSDYIKDVRKKMFAGEYVKECETRCYFNESVGIMSKRERANERWLTPDVVDRVVKAANNDMHVAEPPKFIDVKLGNLCNLSCRMCSAVSSTRWLNDVKMMSDDLPPEYDKSVKRGQAITRWWDSATFEKNMMDILPYVDVIQATGGEPFLNKKLLEIIEKIPDEQCAKMSFWVSSNVQHIDDRWFVALSRFKDAGVNASIDATGKALEYIRQHAEWDTIVENIYRLEECGTSLKISYTHQLFSLEYLPSLYDFAISRRSGKKKMMVQPHILRYPITYRQSILCDDGRNHFVQKYRDYLASQNLLSDHDRESIEAIINDLNNGQHDPDTLSKSQHVTRTMDTYYNRNFADVFPELNQFLKW